MIKWKRWKDLSPLKRDVIDSIDKGASPSDIVSDIQCDYKDDPPSREVVLQAIKELDEEWHIVNVDSEDAPYYKVTAWAHDGVCIRTGKESYTEALQVLKENRIYHRDMLRYGIVTEEEVEKD